MCIAISVLIVAGNWVKKHNVMDLIGWVFSLTLVSMLVVIRTPVQIIDYSNVAQVYEVDNVPIGLAIPASLTTRVGMRLSRVMRWFSPCRTVSRTVKRGCYLAVIWSRKVRIFYHKILRLRRCSPITYKTV
jgi:conjugal transfer mating pair stabilization protein TraG